MEEFKKKLDKIVGTLNQILNDPNIELSKAAQEAAEKARAGDQSGVERLVQMLHQATPYMRILQSIPVGSAAVFTKTGGTAEDGFRFSLHIFGSTDGDPIKELLKIVDKAPGYVREESTINPGETPTRVIEFLYGRKKETLH